MSEKLPEYVFHQFDYLFDKMDGAYFGEAEIAGILYGVKQYGTYPGADYVYRYIQCLQIRIREEKEALRHQKYKRCLAMARFCEERYNYLSSLENYQMTDKEYQQVIGDYWDRWYKRWLELAKKFKDTEAK